MKEPSTAAAKSSYRSSLARVRWRIKDLDRELRIQREEERRLVELTTLPRAVSCATSSHHAMKEALQRANAFIGVMFGRGPDATIPETVPTPLGIPVDLGEIVRDIRAAIALSEKTT